MTPKRHSGKHSAADVDVETIVVGASFSGLSVAACLRRRGLDVTVLERSNVIGACWRRHYDSLHLHTSRRLSGLPYFPMPRRYPRYPSRDEATEYLEAYAARFGIEPEFGQAVVGITRDGGRWAVRTSDDKVRRAERVVVATGNTRVPVVPSWPGQEAFGGEISHSSTYRDASALRGARVLVVGFGNSAGEIAVDLARQGAKPTLSVRGPVNVLPRDLLGLSIVTWGIVLRPLPGRVADLVSKPLLRVKLGNTRRAGLEPLPYGPIVQIRRHGRIPLIDSGTLAGIRHGDIGVRPGIERFTEAGVLFVDGRSEAYDAVVLATGYRARLADLVAEVDGVLDADGNALTSGGRSGAPGLYFCGMHLGPTGMLREIGKEARRIAADIARSGDSALRSSSMTDAGFPRESYKKSR